MKSGYYHIHVIVYSILDAIYSSARKKNEREAEAQEKENLKEEKNLFKGKKSRLITDQKAFASMAFGNSDVGYAGCETIAVYNAIKLLEEAKGEAVTKAKEDDKEVTLSQVIRRAMKGGMLVRGGRFGTNPFKIGDLLKSYGIKSKRYESLKALKEDFGPRSGKLTYGKSQAKESKSSNDKTDLIIISMWNDASSLISGVHTYIVKADPDSFTAYNRYGTRPETFQDLDQCIGKGRFIVAYVI